MGFKPLIPDTVPAVASDLVPKPDVSLESETITLATAENNLFISLENILTYLKSNHLSEIAGTEKLLAYNNIQNMIFQIEHNEFNIRKRIEQQQQQQQEVKTNV